ncbi:MAG TPA: SDR family NAD(P)-dependent oxidoreductase [Mycobacterium sp.]|nr:SDR family NAD(P)-dependent oxidoreductase [Mycobacterium sp.]
MSTKSSTTTVEIQTAAAKPGRHTPKGEVALVMNAGTDSGFRIARELVHSGYRVAVSGRQAMQLTRIVAGLSASRVRAIAADPTDKSQVAKLVRRVESGFGQQIAVVVRAEDDVHTLCEVTK